jgi:putative hydrolase of the HAD superfamily
VEGEITQAALLFDFGGTLDADGVPWKERFQRLFLARGVDAPPERFDPIFYAVDDALVGSVSPSLSFLETVRAVATGVARGLGITDPALPGDIAAAFADEALAVAERNLPMLARLAQQYRLGVVSNFYGNLATVCDDVGVRPLVGVMVDSVWAGCVKPDPRIFRRAVDALRVAPAEATFVGDSLSRDMAGARAMGMPHIWLAGGAAGAACCAGDRVIRTLIDLEGVL